VIIRLAVLVQYRRVTDKQTNRETDRQTDGRTDTRDTTTTYTAIAERLAVKSSSKSSCRNNSNQDPPAGFKRRRRKGSLIGVGGHRPPWQAQSHNGVWEELPLGSRGRVTKSLTAYQHCTGYIVLLEVKCRH